MPGPSPCPVWGVLRANVLSEALSETRDQRTAGSRDLELWASPEPGATPSFSAPGMLCVRLGTTNDEERRDPLLCQVWRWRVIARQECWFHEPRALAGLLCPRIHEAVLVPSTLWGLRDGHWVLEAFLDDPDDPSGHSGQGLTDTMPQVLLG